MVGLFAIPQNHNQSCINLGCHAWTKHPSPISRFAIWSEQGFFCSTLLVCYLNILMWNCYTYLQLFIYKTFNNRSRETSVCHCFISPLHRVDFLYLSSFHGHTVFSNMLYRSLIEHTFYLYPKIHYNVQDTKSGQGARSWQQTARGGREKTILITRYP